MCLKQKEVETIKSVIKSRDEDTMIYLFGSRVDDRKKGGDIDRLIQSEKIGLKEIVKIKTKLYVALSDRKVDIVLEKDRGLCCLL